MDSHFFLFFLLIPFLTGYLIASIPVGYLMGKAMGLGDIRKVGSGNIGATNMVRAGGKKLGALVLLLDIAKSAGALYASLSWITSGHHIFEFTARSSFFDGILFVICLLSVFIGHMFPVWLRFKGGKGISIMIGTLLILPFIDAIFDLYFWPVGVFIGVWLGCYAMTKTSSLAGLTSTLAVVAYFFVTYLLNHAARNSTVSNYEAICLTMTIAYSLAALLVFYRHKDNIRRLLRGEELAFRKKEKQAV